MDDEETASVSMIMILRFCAILTVIMFTAKVFAVGITLTWVEVFLPLIVIFGIIILVLLIILFTR